MKSNASAISQSKAFGLGSAFKNLGEKINPTMELVKGLFTVAKKVFML